MIKSLMLCAILISITSTMMIASKQKEKATQFYLFVGAYTETEDEGIYVYKFDAIDGDLKYIATAKGIKNASYLAISEKKNLLIAVNEIGQYKGQKSGSVTSFKINPETGYLTKLNQVASGGGAPCYVSIDKNASHAFVSNYSGGNIAVLPIDHSGKLGEIVDLKQHTGKSANEKRQNAPFAHSVALAPKEDFALAVDLGIDKVITYEIDYKRGQITEQSSFSLKPGSGPRHLAFHPNKKMVFIINELNSTITSCSYDQSSGALHEIESVSTLPADFSEKSYCADIHVSPDGNYLYGSNRGHNSIVMLRIDQKSGKLAFIGHQSVKGEWPRNFMIDPTGKFLLVANQHTNNIVVFKIDQDTGLLKSNGVEVQVSKPVCLKMMAIR